MGSLRRKRKGLEILPSSGMSLPQLTVILSPLSLGDYSRQRKKYKEGVSLQIHLVGVLRGKLAVLMQRLNSAGRKKSEKEYDLGAQIGQGKFGSVVLCRSKVTGEEFACKMLRKGEEPLHQEVENMQHLSGHPGVVTLKAVYEDLESFYLVMELCPEGRLLDKMANIVMTWELTSMDRALYRTNTKGTYPKTKFQAHVTLTSQQLTLSTGLELDRFKITASGFLNDDCSLVLSSDGSRSRVEQHDCGLIDALTVAISRVRISEPERSRLCWPTSPIQQEFSSNSKINNLWTAF
ncbi:hypothetical protein DKX38_026654 [Salix brachista]|uniref:Protein kinase domain-containing protein n=1 Tax=Salix brachista TaxID=2182728 RepID=A0A5N5JBY9_9ROSI|nr:hypothetical protein DKX38_026654 [Salix brachista]